MSYWGYPILWIDLNFSFSLNTARISYTPTKHTWSKFLLHDQYYWYFRVAAGKYCTTPFLYLGLSWSSLWRVWSPYKLYRQYSSITTIKQTQPDNTSCSPATLQLVCPHSDMNLYSVFNFLNLVSKWVFCDF